MTTTDILAQKIAKITNADIETSRQVALKIAERQVVRAICEEPLYYRKEKETN